MKKIYLGFLLSCFVLGDIYSGEYNANNVINYYPLHQAVRDEDVEGVQRLIVQGFRLNQLDELGDTALAEAASIGNLRLGNLLIQGGADVNLGSDFPLLLAAGNWHLEFLQALLQNPQVDINRRNPEGMTALNHALRNNSREAASILIDAGADVNISSNENMSPLHYAVLWNNFNLVQRLLASGADHNLRDIRNESPLDFARRLQGIDLQEEQDGGSPREGGRLNRQPIIDLLANTPVNRICG